MSPAFALWIQRDDVFVLLSPEYCLSSTVIRRLPPSICCSLLRSGRIPRGDVVIFGGRQNSKISATVHVLDSTRSAWRSLAKLKNAPKARATHSMVALPSGELVVFGGYGSHGMYFGDVHVLRGVPHSPEWIKPKLQGEGPDKRAGHSASHIGGGRILFGKSGRRQTKVPNTALSGELG